MSKLNQITVKITKSFSESYLTKFKAAQVKDRTFISKEREHRRTWTEDDAIVVLIRP